MASSNSLSGGSGLGWRREHMATWDGLPPSSTWCSPWAGWFPYWTTLAVAIQPWQWKTQIQIPALWLNKDQSVWLWLPVMAFPWSPFHVLSPWATIHEAGKNSCVDVWDDGEWKIHNKPPIFEGHRLLLVELPVVYLWISHEVFYKDIYIYTWYIDHYTKWHYHRSPIFIFIIRISHSSSESLVFIHHSSSSSTSLTYTYIYINTIFIHLHLFHEDSKPVFSTVDDWPTQDGLWDDVACALGVAGGAWPSRGVPTIWKMPCRSYSWILMVICVVIFIVIVDGQFWGCGC